MEKNKDKDVNETKKTKKTKAEEMEILQKEKEDLKDKWIRVLAEFENYKKNAFKEKQEWIKYANEKIILDVLDVLDNFDRAIATEVNEKNYPSYVKGVEMIFQQMNSILKKNDVIKIDSLGKEFDPNYHDAWSHIPATEPENTVVAVIQNGYMIGEKVIRPSRVAVSNGEEPQKEE